MIEDKEISKILDENRNTEIDVANKLIESANKNGGKDNSTAIVVYM